MTSPAPHAPEPATMPRARDIGRFAVRAEAKAVARFAAATGQPEARGRVTPTFPITWMTRPDIRAAIAAALPAEAGFALVHAAQEFRYDGALAIGKDYTLDLALEGPDARGLIRLRATLRADGCNEVLLTLDSQFILHPVGEAS